MFEDAEGRSGTATTSSVDLGRVVIGQFRNLTVDDGRQRVYFLNLKRNHSALLPSAPENIDQL